MSVGQWAATAGTILQDAIVPGVEIPAAGVAAAALALHQMSAVLWRMGQPGGWVRRRLLKSFTIPNAKCPLCGAAVFFYQSPHGGRVFFDDLGPPWPKHQPCTNTYFRPGRVAGVETPITVVGGYRRPAWQGEGWEPLSNVTVTRSDNDIVFVGGTSLGNRKAWCLGTRNSTAVASADGPMFSALWRTGRAGSSWLSCRPFRRSTTSFPLKQLFFLGSRPQSDWRCGNAPLRATRKAKTWWA